MRPGTAPEAGDLVVAPLDGFPGHYTLRVPPRPAQIVCGTYADALARARRFAARQGVNAWVAVAGRHPALLARHRGARHRQAG